MKKMFLMLIAVTVGTLSGFAQSDLVATLSHGSNLSTYYGADALSEAYTAAAEGDVITLSPGTFNAVNIEKAITVRGAGMQPMEGNGYVSTQIRGSFSINFFSSSNSGLTLEGIQCLGGVLMYNSNNILPSVNTFKSRFYGITVNGFNMNAHSCVFEGLEANGNATLNCQNCVIAGAYAAGYSSDGTIVDKIIATNCIFEQGGNRVRNSDFKNCIIITGQFTNGYLPESCSAQNCIGINWGETLNIFENIVGASNVMIEGLGETAYSKVFKTLKGVNLTLSETYELTPTAAATYLGDDGKQVGIYGGTNPFDPTPSNPQIKKFTVDSSVNSGKLSVKINVE